MENRPPDKTLKFQLGPREALTIVGVATLAFAYLQAKFGVRAESGINPTGTLNGEVIGPDCAICTPDATETCVPTPIKVTPTKEATPTKEPEPTPTRVRNRPVGTLVPDTGAGQVEGNGFGGLLPELVTVVGAASGLSAARLVWMRRRRHSKAIHTPQK